MSLKEHILRVCLTPKTVSTTGQPINHSILHGISVIALFELIFEASGF
jgi:hypothetical protein